MFKWFKMVFQGWYRRFSGIKTKESERRYAICMSCKDKLELVKGEYICSHCGCDLKAASLADDKHCSIGKW